MKKRWEDPKILLEQFVPNEYVAACYKIKCTTPNNNSSYEKLYNDADGDGQFNSEKDKLVYGPSSFHGCNNWHKGVIRDSAPIANGFVVREDSKHWWGGGTVVKAESVFWWKESFRDGSVDYHVMVPGAENYETNPNAS